MTTIDEPPRVLHVITGLCIGGAEANLVSLATREQNRFRPLAVAAMVGEGPNRKLLEAAGVPVTDLGMARGSANPMGLVRLARLIRRTRPAIVQSWMYHADLVSLLALWISGRRKTTRLVWGLRCSNMDTSRYPWRLAATIRACRILSRFPAAVIANSEAGIAAHRAIGYRPKRFIHIDNGIDNNRFHPDPQARRDVRDSLDIEENTILVAIVGRVDPMKGHEVFLQVLDRLDGVCALAIGKGTESLPGHPRLYRLGMRDDVPRLLAACDMLVTASLFGEGFPNTVGEAMSCGVPVAATDVGDTRRIVGETGIVVSPGNVDALTTAMETLVDDAGRRKRFGLKARQRIEQHFSLDRMIEAYSKAYRSLGP